ncbi:MAG TPA: c-type cytochrome [Rhizomicrobium sp.]|nr:c-type cytochrome [Rhizomicrobium sp.]
MTKTMAWKVGLVLLLAGIGATQGSAVYAQGNDSAAGQKIVTTVCQNCHGPDGNSVSATFPRLNGQQADYIVAQLKAFRDHTRGDPHAMAYMWGMAAQLDDPTIGSIAKYLAGQSATKAETGGALATAGRQLYLNGDPAHNVPACAACHGQAGEGNGPIPRLTGQHGDYLRKQLEAFRSLLRNNDVMHANTQDMTDSQIEAVISYLAND